MTELFDLSPEGFGWAAGIEDTFIGQTERAGERVLDEYAITHHYQYYREDLDRIKSLGVQAMRYGMPWYKAEPEKGRFDWDWIDRAIDHAHGTGVEIIFDLMHYGTPLWLDNQFLNSDYEKHVADWAAAFTRRFKDRVRYYTPFNEPLISSELSGLRGIWPPYLRGADGQVKMLRNISRGMTRTIEAIRDEYSEAIMVQVDAAGEVLPDTPDLAEAAARETAKTFVATDLVLGMVGQDHILRDWLLGNGMSEADLQWHLDRPQHLEFIGTNYYPETSQQKLVRYGDELIKQAMPGRAAGMRNSVKQFAERYGRPVIITECSINGTVEQRAQWLREVVETIPQIRAEGIPLVGFIWFPVLDLIDWVYRAGRPLEEFITRQGPKKLNPDQVANFMRWMRFTSFDNMPLEAFIAPMGLWTLKMGFDGTFERVATPLVAQYQAAVADNDVGPIKL